MDLETVQTILSSRHFHPVIDLPDNVPVFNFKDATGLLELPEDAWGIGPYNEKRPGMYRGPLYGDNRDIHMGLDIICPKNTPVKSFADGEIYALANNNQPYDFGYTVICRHQFDALNLYALYGHLRVDSCEDKEPGDPVRAGQIIGWVGGRSENGGWHPHLHFQLSQIKPEDGDLPGVVTDAERDQALVTFPDPRWVLGPLHP